MNCVRLLSHIAFALNEQARATFIELLPTSLAGEIAVPSAGEESLDNWERQLLSIFSADLLPDATSAAEPEAAVEGGELEAEEIPPSQGGAALVALLLSAAPSPSRAAPLLFNLPLHLQAPTLHRLLTLSPLSCTRGLVEEEREFIEEIRRQMQTSEHWGLETAREIMRAAISPRMMQRLLQNLVEIDREAALLLEQHLYEFIDLLQLSERDLQVLLANESNETIARALLDFPEGVQKRFLRHVSKRRTAMITEEAERYALTTPIEIEETRRAILSTARFLYSTRRITTYFASLQEAGEEREEDFVEADEEQDEKKEKRERKSRGESPPSPQRKRILFAAGVIAALLLWYIALYSGDSAEDAEPRAQSTAAEAGGGAKRGAAAVVQSTEGGQEANPAVEREISARALDREQPAAVADAQIQAEVEVPGLAKLQVDEAADYAQLDGDDGEPGHVLELRVGRLRATVVDANFELRTPLVQIKGPVGARFSTRVVLDATTAITVEAKWVEVRSQVRPEKKWRLLRGDRGVFTGDGEANIVTNEE